LESDAEVRAEGPTIGPACPMRNPPASFGSRKFMHAKMKGVDGSQITSIGHDLFSAWTRASAFGQARARLGPIIAHDWPAAKAGLSDG